MTRAAGGAAPGAIRVGVGGWTFAPWRDGVFFPQKLPQKRELEYASRALTAIEINGTYYGAQKPASFQKWRAETPDGFVFSVKASRFCTNRRVLAEGAASVERFLGSGIVELKEKLGPINWQLPPTKAFDPGDIEAFLQLLPATLEGLPLRHVIEARHPSFRDPAFVALLRARGVATVLTDSPKFPQIADATAPFVYARLQAASEDEPQGYAPRMLDQWTERAHAYACGETPADLDAMATSAERAPRDVFVFMINGFKPKAPAAALAMLERLRERA